MRCRPRFPAAARRCSLRPASPARVRVPADDARASAQPRRARQRDEADDAVEPIRVVEAVCRRRRRAWRRTDSRRRRDWRPSPGSGSARRARSCSRRRGACLLRSSRDRSLRADSGSGRAPAPHSSTPCSGIRAAPDRPASSMPAKPRVDRQLAAATSTILAVGDVDTGGAKRAAREVGGSMPITPPALANSRRPSRAATPAVCDYSVELPAPEAFLPIEHTRRRERPSRRSRRSADRPDRSGRCRAGC